VQSSWIALSAVYPQAFDEQFHFGIIQVYSHHWLPFLRSQPPNADPYGAVTRDPSFLYHYVMSFPYRFIELFAHSQAVQVIDLRFINIALFAGGLILFRKVLSRTGMSQAAINSSILITTLIPVAPQLAGQINYDNMLIPMVAWACLLTFNAIDQLEKRRFTFQTLLALLSVCLLSSMVKYEFLPIFLSIVVFLAVFAWRRLRGHWRTAWQQALADWHKGRGTKWLTVAAFVVAFTLFAQRDITNVLIYHTVVPDCSQVLNIQQCSAYSVWIHDYQSHKAVVDAQVHVNPNPVKYLGEWIYWLWYRLFFAINGPNDNFRNYPPLPLPAGAFALLVVVSIAAVAARWRETFTGKPYTKLLGLVVIIYLLTLLGAGYQKYLSTGVLELMNGRYLFPILLPGVAVAIPALIAWTRSWSSNIRYIAAVVLLICFLEGGGVLTFIARSDYKWYWPNATVVRINNDARKILEPVLVDGPRYYSGNKWFFD